jgi:hypothetical protein
MEKTVSYCLLWYGGQTPKMKAHELLNSPAAWCQKSPAQDRDGKKLPAFDPRAVRWCAVSAVQKAYPPSEWGRAMDRVLLALSVSELGLNQMTKSDKACSLMEWNDHHQSTFREIQEILLTADV